MQYLLLHLEFGISHLDEDEEESLLDRKDYVIAGESTKEEGVCLGGWIALCSTATRGLTTLIIW